MPSHSPGLAQQIAYYEQRLQLDPDSRAFLPLADLLRRAGRQDQARELLERGLARHPQFVSARAALGLVLTELGESELAREELTRVLDADDDHLLALRLLARDAGRREDWAQACRRYERLLRLEPEDAEVRRALRHARDRLEALPATPTSPAPAGAAVDSPPPPGGDPGRADAGRGAGGGGLRVGNGFETPTLAELYLRQGHPGKAREILERILAADPDRPDAQAVLARLEEAADEDETGSGGTPPTSEDEVAAGGSAARSGPDREGPGPVDPSSTGRPQDLERFRHWIDRRGGGGDTAH